MFIFAQNKTDNKGRKQGPWEVKFEGSDVLRYKGQFKDDKPYGKFVYYYPKGEVSAISVFEPNGEVARTTFFDIEGEPMSYGKYVNQERDSTWTFFADGNVVSRQNYVRGNREGKKIVYYDNGKIYEETTFENDIENGPYRMYHANGKVKIKVDYVDGNREGKIVHYYSDGKLETEGFYRNAVENGFWRYYDERGRVTKEVFFKNGKIVLEGEDIKDELQKMKEEGKI